MRRWRPRLLAALRRRVREGRLGLFILHNPRGGRGRRGGAAAAPRWWCCRSRGRIPDYEWHLPAHLDTPEGFAFEHRIATALRDAIAGWLD